jgi:hypothetical protein
MTDVREMTLIERTCASAALSASVVPSARCSWSSSPDRFSKGSTATDVVVSSPGDQPVTVHEPDEDDAYADRPAMRSGGTTRVRAGAGTGNTTASADGSASGTGSASCTSDSATISTGVRKR